MKRFLMASKSGFLTNHNLSNVRILQPQVN